MPFFQLWRISTICTWRSRRIVSGSSYLEHLKIPKNSKELRFVPGVRAVRSFVSFKSSTSTCNYIFWKSGSMPQHTTPRQPLSCENCRKRRIKCESEDQAKVPCSTCVRRGYAQSCYYKKVAGAAQVADTSTENELLHRIRNLEDLLKQQIAQSTQSPSAFSQGKESSRSDGTSPSVPTIYKPRHVGSIITSPDGYQYFSPRASNLNTNLVPELVSAVPAPTCATNFPFTPNVMTSRSALLEILPPLQQCDELKSVFFEVFSPVS